MSKMNGINIIDNTKDAVWLVNRGLFPFVHGMRPGVRFEPGVAVKISPKLKYKVMKKDEKTGEDYPVEVEGDDPWLKEQTLIVACPDPTSGDGDMPAPIEPDTVLRQTNPKSKKQ